MPETSMSSCPECTKEIKSNRLLFHRVRMHGFTYNLRERAKELATKYSRREALAKATGELVICPDCGDKFQSGKSIGQHRGRSHGIVIDPKERNRQRWQRVREVECARRKEKRRNGTLKKVDTRPYVLRNKYGMTENDYALLLDRQGGVCAICSQPQPGRRLAVDHDHASGRVRGLLCNRCNSCLERLDTFPGWTTKAKMYLESFVGNIDYASSNKMADDKLAELKAILDELEAGNEKLRIMYPDLGL